MKRIPASNIVSLGCILIIYFISTMLKDLAENRFPDGLFHLAVKNERKYNWPIPLCYFHYLNSWMLLTFQYSIQFLVISLLLTKSLVNVNDSKIWFYDIPLAVKGERTLREWIKYWSGEFWLERGEQLEMGMGPVRT